MKFTYPAVIRKKEDGSYLAFAPDLACCQAEADSLEEAVEKINEAVYEWIDLELAEEDCNLPPVSDPADMELLESDQVRNICVNIKFYDGWDE